MQYCYYCGESLPDEGHFCGKCGRAQDKNDHEPMANKLATRDSAKMDEIVSSSKQLPSIEETAQHKKEVKSADYCPLKWYTIITILLTVASAAISGMIFSQFSRAADLVLVRSPAARPLLQSAESISWINVGITVVATISLLVWFYRAYANLPGLTDKATRWSPGWAIGAWFVPILNLWRSIQVVSELWHKSSSLQDQKGVGPWVFGAWWYGNAALLISSKVVESSMKSADTIVAFSDVLRSMAYVMLGQIILSMMIIWVIWRITQLQKDKYQSIMGERSV